MSPMVHELVTRAAERRPDAAAVALDGRLTYGELAALSDGVAAMLQGIGVAAGDRVCLLAAQTPRTVAAILGTLKAGASYVPLDPASPAARTQHMLSATDTRWLLVDDRWMALDLLPKNPNGKIEGPRLRELFAAEIGAAS